MSEEAGDDEVSDAELDNDFDDYDPLLEDGPSSDPGADEGGEGEEEEEEEGEEGEEADEDGSASEAGTVKRGRVRARAPRAAPRPREDGGGNPEAAAAVETRPRWIVPPEARVTSNQLTPDEMARAIGIRAKQIATHPNPYTATGDLTDPKTIALEELRARKSPLLLYRRVGRTPEGAEISEVWAVREMSYPPLN